MINFALNDIIVTRAAATQCAPPLIRGMWASGVYSTIFGWNEEVGEGYTREFQVMVDHAVRQEVEPILAQPLPLLFLLLLLQLSSTSECL
jgi:hypothetical protein